MASVLKERLMEGLLQREGAGGHRQGERRWRLREAGWGGTQSSTPLF